MYVSYVDFCDFKKSVVFSMVLADKPLSFLFSILLSQTGHCAIEILSHFLSIDIFFTSLNPDHYSEANTEFCAKFNRFVLFTPYNRTYFSISINTLGYS